MDKEILRIVIIATGMLVVLGMLAWAYVKDKRAQEDMEFYDDDEAEEPLTVLMDDEDFDIAPMAAVDTPQVQENPDRYYQDDDEEEDHYYAPDEEPEPLPRAAVPAIIQFSIITKGDEDFNGADLVEAFEMVGLEYGSLKIFERLDENRLVDYGVACIVEPGTFPEKDLDQFHCPGIVFFMQPEALDDARAVFEDYVETIGLLAKRLDGVILDHRRQHLTEATVEAIRRSL